MAPGCFGSSDYNHEGSDDSHDSGSKQEINPDTNPDTDQDTIAPSDGPTQAPFASSKTALRLIVRQALFEGVRVTTAGVITTVRDGQLDVVEPIHTKAWKDVKTFQVNYPDTRDYNSQSNDKTFKGTFNPIFPSGRVTARYPSEIPSAYEFSIEPELNPDDPVFQTNKARFRNQNGFMIVEKNGFSDEMDAGEVYESCGTSNGHPMLARAEPVNPGSS